MKTISTIEALHAALQPHRRAGHTIGLVPTMGYLHHGHMALAERARAENDIVVLSIFVNPTQFGPSEDFSTYPRDLDRDLALCREHGVDLVFAPEAGEMYPEPMETSVDVASLSGILIGAQRPGHFRGVATVVAKLFNIAGPNRAYFGEKDYQQLQVIRRMARDLSSPVAIVGVPTVREPDGLAASSRNVRLSPEDREAASVIALALALGEERARDGERDPARLLEAMRDVFRSEPRADLRSLDICHARTLRPLAALGGEPAVILVTARFGSVLLIDGREIADAANEGDIR